MGRYRTIYTENQNSDGYESEKNKPEILKAPELELTGAAKKFTSMVVVTSVLFLVAAITIAGVAIRKIV